MSNATPAKPAVKKSSGLVNKTLHFLVHNGFAFTVSVMCLVHSILLAIFLFAGVMPLVQINAFSVLVYIFAFFLCKFGYIRAVYFSIILEVTFYTIISTYYVGLRCGTYCFLFSIVPIIIYFGVFLYQGAKRWSIVLMLVLNFATFIALYIRYAPIEPVYDVAPVTRLVLVCVSAFAMVFSTIFYNTIYIYTAERELGDLEERNQQLSSDAHEDALTNLLNRRGFLPLVQTMMDDHTQDFCIAFCDLDNFKRVNDTYGHEGGDEVLKHVTNLIRKELPGCDICRWGGEEFVILMRGYNMITAKEKMEELRKHIESNPTIFFNKRITITSTIGLEEYKAAFNEPEEIIKVADARMYYGKQHGRNILIFEDLD